MYIPLGGNRKGKGRTYLNLIIVFFLTGLWHGAGWNFIVWGLFNGLFLLIERNGTVHRALEKIPAFFRHLYAMVVVTVGWVFFETDTLEASFAYLGKMFSFQSMSVSGLSAMLTPVMIGVLVFAVIFCTPVLPAIRKRFCDRFPAAQGSNILFAGKAALYLAGLVFCVVKLATGEFNPFIYFRF